jgi:DNA primase
MFYSTLKYKKPKNRLIFDQKDINKVLSKVNFLLLFKEFIVLRKKGYNYVGRCPFCKTFTKNDFHFVVNPKKKLYKCFECGVGGTNVISFLKRYFDQPFDRILFYLNKKYSHIENIKHIGVSKSRTYKGEQNNLPF